MLPYVSGEMSPDTRLILSFGLDINTFFWTRYQLQFYRVWLNLVMLDLVRLGLVRLVIEQEILIFIFFFYKSKYFFLVILTLNS